MYAAAEGKSRLGIPKAVGEEFVAADENGEMPDARVLPKGAIVAGTVHVAPDGHVLLLRRSAKEENFAGHWSLPGGNGDPGESAEEAADRENAEELGNTSPQGPKRLMDRRSTPTGKTFHTFAKPVAEKFSPKLNNEHTGAGWFGLHELPSPIHPAVKERLSTDLGATDDMSEEDWATLHKNFAGWARGEEIAKDEQIVIDLDDDENQLKRLLAHLQETSSIGHSFDVVVDPGDSDHEKKFFIDGDGAFRIRGIKSTGKKPRHAQDQVQATTAANSGFPPIVGSAKKLKHAQDGLCGACGGAGNVHGDMCSACGGSGVAAMTHAPMKPGMGAMDELLALDRAPFGLMIDRHGLAFDYAAPAKGNRTESPDGHLHVEVSNISKAAVNPYRGDEIPQWKTLGLTADKIYYLFRDPDELKKAASTFNNKPVLDEHVPVSAADHKPEHVIGSTGTDAEFDGTYLKNSLVIWADKGIKAVKSEKKKELSSAYRYRADMTPGSYNGTRYDGVMRDIVGNHVALVSDGRAGPDVVVGDSKNPLIPKEAFTMTKRVLMSSTASIAYGALMAHLQPMLAMDASIDLTKGLRNIRASNWKAKRPVLAAYVRELVKGKLQPKFAQDGSIKAGLDAVLDMIEGGMPKAEDEWPPKDKEKTAEDEDKNEEDEDNESESAEDEDVEETAEDGDPDDEDKKKLEFSKDKKAKDKKAKDEKPSAGARDKKAKDEAEKEDKKAMDAATDKKVQAAIKQERELQQAIYAAKDHVRPRVGELSSMAFDSVEGVYLHAIQAAGKDTKPLAGVKADALKFMFDNLSSPDSGKRNTTIAMDSSGGAGSKADFAKRLPNIAKNLDRIGSA